MDEDSIKVGVAEEEDCRRIISIEIDQDEYREERGKVLDSFVKEAALPGFRKGKVPPGMVEKRFSDEIHSEVLKSIIPKAYSHAVASENLQPIGEPVFKDLVTEEDKPLTFSVELEVAPEIELDDYRGVEVEEQEVEVEKGDIERVLENLRDRYADFEKVDRPCDNEDVVVIDYLPLDENGDEEEEKRVSDYSIQLGAGQILADFEKELIGCKAGDTKDVEITYPDNYKPEELAGKKIKYRFEVKEVKEKHPAELDDDFASKLDKSFQSLDDLKKDIEKRLIEEKHKEAMQKKQEEAIDKLIEANPFEIPSSMIDRYKEAMREEAESKGVAAPEGEKEKKEHDEVLDRIARRNIKRYFLIDHIIREEELSVDDKRVDREIESISEGASQSMEDVKNYFLKNKEQYNNLKRSLLEKKVFEIILGEEKNTEKES